MYCRCSFKVYTNLMTDVEMYEFMDFLGVEGGITEGCLYFGLSEKNTEEDFLLTHFIHECISAILKKKDILNALKERYNCNYVLDIKFSDIEEEIKNKTSFEIDDEIKSFIKDTDTIYNLNDGYFEE